LSLTTSSRGLFIWEKGRNQKVKRTHSRSLICFGFASFKQGKALRVALNPKTLMPCSSENIISSHYLTPKAFSEPQLYGSTSGRPLNSSALLKTPINAAAEYVTSF
jgi:hypothetical protein